MKGLKGARNESGALTVPMALCLALATTAGLGLVGLVVNARMRMDRVMQLDRCVAKTAIRLESILTFVERSNRVITATRASLALMPEPTTRTALRALLTATVSAQELRLAEWRMRQAAWFAPGFCGVRADLPNPLSPPPFTRNPSDLLGPKGLRRTATELALRRIAWPDETRAQVRFISNKWEARFR